MPWHMQRVRRRRCDLRILPCRGKPVGSQRRGVAGMDDVVRQPRMVGMRCKQWHQDCQRLVLMGQRRITRRHRGKHRQSVKGRALYVIREHGMQRVHLGLIGLRALFERRLRRIEKCAQRIDIRLLPRSDLGLGRSQRARFGHLAHSPLPLRLVRVLPQLRELRHGNAPVRHGARRIVLGNRLKLHLRDGVAEGVQQRHSPLHGRLRAARTRSREGHLSQLFARRRRVVVMVVLRHCRRRLGKARCRSPQARRQRNKQIGIASWSIRLLRTLCTPCEGRKLPLRGSVPGPFDGAEWILTPCTTRLITPAGLGLSGFSPTRNSSDSQAAAESGFRNGVRRSSGASGRTAGTTSSKNCLVGPVGPGDPHQVAKFLGRSSWTRSIS